MTSAIMPDQWPRAERHTLMYISSIACAYNGFIQAKTVHSGDICSRLDEAYATVVEPLTEITVVNGYLP